MFANQGPALEPGSTILVTGVSGFAGSHVADQLLAAGYHVRGTTRDVVKNAWVPDMFAKYGREKFELVTVVDGTKPTAFDSVLKGTSGVVHLASDMTFSPDPNVVIPPTVKYTMNLLKAASHHSTVKRFTLSSSCASAASPGDTRIIDKDTWNDSAIERAWAPAPYEPSRGFDVYAASKALSERDAWQWYDKEKPGFILNAVLPTMNFGRSLDVVNQGHPSTSGLIQALFNNDATTVSNGAEYFCLSVEDNARLHVAALLHPDISHERIFAYGLPYTWRGIQAILRKLYPQKTFDAIMPESKLDQTQIVHAPRAEALLREMGRDGWTGIEEIVKLNTQDLV